jgi:hypothetical protein
MNFSLKGWPNDVIPVLQREIADFIEEPEIT